VVHFFVIKNEVKEIQQYGLVVAILKVFNNGKDHIFQSFKNEDEVFIFKNLKFCAIYTKYIIVFCSIYQIMLF
jgi:hypothetical protein